MRRDDALIDALSGGGPVQTGSADDHQLAALLANWRAEILEEPMPAGPHLDAIVAAVDQEISARHSRIDAGKRKRGGGPRPGTGCGCDFRNMGDGQK
ncbi:anti-sigma-D factor RsdA [Nocardia sp.]|uniref:anti-sigma-D factor RsdA n=1 Tax=Nocardia sp. TaxID=1821 RepID=UPI0034554192